MAEAMRIAERIALPPACPQASPGEPPAVPEARPPAVLFAPSVICPRCRARPRLRITRALAVACAGLPPGELVGTFQCKCKEVFALTAGAFAGAWDLRR